MCTCRGHNSPRLRRFRARACLSFCVAAGGEVFRRCEDVTLVKAARRPNFVCYAWRPEASAVCFSHQHAAQPATPDQYNPKPRFTVLPKPVYRVDRRENARAAGREVAILDSRRHTSITNVMRPRCVGGIRYVTTAAYIPELRASRCAIIRFQRETEGDAYLNPISRAKLPGTCRKEDWPELRKRRGFDVPICRKLISRNLRKSRNVTVGR